MKSAFSAAPKGLVTNIVQVQHTISPVLVPCRNFHALQPQCTALCRQQASQSARGLCGPAPAKLVKSTKSSNCSLLTVIKRNVFSDSKTPLQERGKVDQTFKWVCYYQYLAHIYAICRNLIIYVPLLLGQLSYGCLMYYFCEFCPFCQFCEIFLLLFLFSHHSLLY